MLQRPGRSVSVIPVFAAPVWAQSRHPRPCARPAPSYHPRESSHCGRVHYTTLIVLPEGRRSSRRRGDKEV